jgi:hypothetical protein
MLQGWPIDYDSLLRIRLYESSEYCSCSLMEMWMLLYQSVPYHQKTHQYIDSKEEVISRVQEDARVVAALASRLPPPATLADADFLRQMMNACTAHQPQLQ